MASRRDRRKAERQRTAGKEGASGGKDWTPPPASAVAGALMGHATGRGAAAMPRLADKPSMLRVAVGHLQAGRLADAERHLDAVLEQDPDYPPAVQLKGVVAHQAGRTEEALDLLARAVELAPDYAEAHHNRGLVLASRGDLEEALAAFAQAVKARPDYAEAWLNRGTALAALGRYEEALAALERAIAQRADYAEALLNAGNVLSTLGRSEAALARYDEVLALRPEYALAHANRADCLDALGRHEEAREGLRKAAGLDPEDREIEANWRASLARLLPAWHFTMLADAGRNEAFAGAIQAQVFPGARVLDIGTGSGLLAMLAARAGAGAVYAVELNPALAEAAREIIAANGLADRITVLAGSSLGLDAARDLGGPVDLVMAEIFDSSLLGEAALPTFRHAVTALMKPGGTVLPMQASVRACVIEAPGLRAANPLRQVMGFDLTAFDRFRNPLAARQVDLATLEHRRLTAPQPVASFDFADPPRTERWRRLTLPVETAGEAHAVAFWFELTLAPGIIASSGPDGVMKHWGQAVQFMDAGVAVQPGESLVVKVGHTDARLYFDIEGRA